MFCVGKSIIVFLSIVSITLIACSIQSVTADHLEPGTGIYVGYDEVLITPARDSNYVVSLQAILRTGDGQLINVTESSASAAYIPHQITDHVFDTLMGEKEIVTIDNIKYEKVQYSGKPDMKKLVEIYNRPSHYIGHWVITLCSLIDNHGYTCVDPFSASTAFVSLVEDNVVENHWTILRIIN